MNQSNYLSPVALGLSIGVIWALSVLLMAILAMTVGYGAGFVESLGSLYWGYSSTLPGMFIGTGIALVDGFITGWLIGFLHNLFARSSCCSKKKNK